MNDQRPYTAHLTGNGTTWGPFDDPTTARMFAAFIRDEVDPAGVTELRDPVRELLVWRDTARQQIRELTEAARPEPVSYAGTPAEALSIATDRLARVRAVLREAGYDVAALVDEADGVAQLMRAAVRMREQMQAVNLTGPESTAQAQARANHLRELLDMGRAIIGRARDAMRGDDLDVVGLGDLDVEVAALVAKFRRLRGEYEIGDEVLSGVMEALHIADVQFCGNAVDGVKALVDRAGILARRAADAEHHLNSIGQDLVNAGFGPGMAPVLVAAALAELTQLRNLRQFDIFRLDLAPGDVLVVQTDIQLTDAEAAEIEAVLKAKFPHHRTAVMTSGLSLAAVRTIPPTEPTAGRVVWGVRPTVDMRRTMGWPEILWCNDYDDALSLVRDDAEGVWGWFAADGKVSVHPWPAGTGTSYGVPVTTTPATPGLLSAAIVRAFDNLPTDTTVTADQVEQVLHQAVVDYEYGTPAAPNSGVAHRIMLDVIAESSGVARDDVDGILTWAGADAAAVLAPQQAVPDAG